MSVFKDIILLIPKSLRVRSFIVLLMVFFGMVLEMAGVGLIIPVFNLILNTEQLLEYTFIQNIFSRFSISDEKYFIYAALGLLMFVYVFKALYLSFLSWVQAKFVYTLQAHISRELFNKYIKQPYSFHLDRNSAFLIRNVTTETTQLVESAFLSMMLVINETIVILGLVALMFILTPSKALIMFLVISLGMIVIQLSTRKLLMQWGSERQINEGLKIKTAQEGLGGIKDIKVLARESEILKSFFNHVNTVAKVSANRNAVQQYPRIWIEFLGIFSLMIIILMDISSGASSLTIIPSIAFISAIAFRIMPSSNRFLSAIQSIKYSTPVVNLVKEELSLTDNQNYSKTSYEEPLTFENDICINNISFSYNQKNNILDNISFIINSGEKIGIIGSSGAGKSTFVDLILGLHKPNKGSIKVDGIDIFQNLKRWYEIIAYVPQTIFLSDDTLRRNIAYGLPESEIDNNNIMEAIKLAQLEDFVSDLDHGLETVIGERGVRISGGQRQRIGIARALYNKPKLLILDEATSALDEEIEKEVMDSIYSLDSSITILIIAHRLSTLDKCNKIISLSNGTIKN